MKIFISWSGERSGALANALRDWLPLVLHYVEPWLSKSDIKAGERWSMEVAKGLESCNFGILCVTRENRDSPWILFEASALAKSLQDGRVIPLLLDLDFQDIAGPLAQFQAKKATSADLKELIASLNESASAPVQDATLGVLFQALWGNFESKISEIPKMATPTKHNRPQGEILEELVSSVRNVEARVRDNMEDDFGLRKRRRSRVSPMMMHDMLYRISARPGDPVKLLMMASFVREEAPWVYELALDAYRLLRSGRRNQGLEAIRVFHEAIELLQRGPFAEEIGIDRMVLKILRSDFGDMSEFMNFESEKNIGRERKATPDLSNEATE